MGLHLITGYAGAEHITSADQGSYNAAMMGNGQFVMERGNQFAASIISNNVIRVLDGDLMMQGRHVRMNENTYEELTFDNGAQGYLRNDLIVARYTKDSTTGIEACKLVVIKGTAVESSPADPTYNSGDIINNHVLINDMPLYRVPFSGLNMQPLVCLFSTVKTWETIQTETVAAVRTQVNALVEQAENEVEQAISQMITLTVTTDDDELIGDTVKVTKDSTTLEQTFDASKSLTFHLPELGTWTVTNTNPDHSGSSEVTCEMYGRYSEALAGGFNWKKWVKAGGLSTDGYASLADVLADEKAVRQLVTKHASADILAKAVIENRQGVRAKIASSKNAMKWIGLRDYICDKLLADAETQSDLLASDHWRYILKDGVPYMTSDTAPYGTATNGGTNRGIAYKAFINDINDGPDMGHGNDGNIANTWVQYKFVNPICVKRIRVKAPKHERYHTKTFKIQYSNDGSTFKDIESNKYVFTDNVREIEENVNNDCFALYWRVQATSTNNNTKGFFTNVQFYGRSLNVSVPAMTSDTTPWGKIIYSSQWDGGSSAGRQAFSGADSPWYPSPSDSSGKAYIGYVYPTPTRVRQVAFICHNGNQNEVCVVERSDDGESWEKASDEIQITVDNETKILNVDASPARYWRIRNVSGNIYVANQGGFNLRKVQFYGVDYFEGDDRSYLYDHGVEVLPITTTGAKNPDAITLSAVSGAKASIDVTNAKRLRASVGANASGTVRLVCGSAFRAITSTDMPVSAYLDISSVNGSADVGVDMTSAGTFDVAEMWLE